MGTFLCRRWIAGHGIVGTVRRAGWLSVASSAAFLVPELVQAHTVVSLTAALWLVRVTSSTASQPLACSVCRKTLSLVTLLSVRKETLWLVQLMLFKFSPYQSWNVCWRLLLLL